MPIEFRCTHCNTMLRVPDDTAGRQARCPKCAAVLPIPLGDSIAATVVEPGSAASTPSGPSSASAGAKRPGPPPSESQAFESEGGNPYAAPVTYIAPSDQREPYAVQPIVPTPLDVADVLARGWRIYYDNLANCLLAMLCLMGVMLGALVVCIGVGVVAGIIIIQGLGGPNATAAPFAIAAIVVVLGAAYWLLGIWLQAGMTLFGLNLARGRPAQIGDLFSGGRYLWTFTGVSLAYGLMIGGGAALCFALAAFLVITKASVALILIALAAAVPMVVLGFILALVYFPVNYLVLDRDTGFSESFTTAAEVSRGNRAMLLLLWLVTFGISMIAGAIPIIGSILGLLVAPLNMLLLIVGYLRMTGQQTAGAQVPTSSGGATTTVGDG